MDSVPLEYVEITLGPFYLGFLSLDGFSRVEKIDEARWGEA